MLLFVKLACLSDERLLAAAGLSPRRWHGRRCLIIFHYFRRGKERFAPTGGKRWKTLVKQMVVFCLLVN